MTTITKVLRLTAAASAALLATTSLATAGNASVAGDGTGDGVGVFIEADNTVLMPTELQPGVHKLVIRSARSAGFQLIRPEPGYTKREAVRDIKRIFGDAQALRRFERNTTLAGGAFSEPEDPGIMWVDLQRGTYWAVDTDDNDPTSVEMLTVTVSGPEIPTEMPSAHVTVRAVDGLAFRAPKHMPAKGRLVFRNVDDQVHMLQMARLLPGKTMADFREYVDAGMRGAPPIDFNWGAGAGVIDPGQEMAMRYDLKPGRYVMMCFWPDPTMDMMPHIAMGMYRMIRVG